MLSAIQKYLKQLGPGLLYAGAAIGVSHLVQSTRAGADYGISFIFIILIIHILKYPFFKAGPYYARKHGRSLIEGYKNQGILAIGSYLLVTVGTMFTITAAVAAVTAGILSAILPSSISITAIQIGVVVSVVLLLLLGRLKILNTIIQYLILALSITVVLCVILNLIEVGELHFEFSFPSIFNNEGLVYLLAFLGWMPAPLDLASWHSIWQKESDPTTNWEIDFNTGFWGTAILGMIFVLLGFTVFHSAGVQLENSAGKFSIQLIDSIGARIGIIGTFLAGIAAFGAMYSTTMTVMDAIARVWKEVGQLYSWKSKHLYTGSLIIVAIGGLIIILWFGNQLISLVQLATVLSFLSTPILAYLHYRLCPELFNTKLKKFVGISAILLFLFLSVLYLIKA